MLVLTLQSLKVRGHFRVLRGRRNTLEACQDQRVVFAWQAQHFLLMHVAFAWQAQHFVTLRRQSQKSWQGQHLVMCLKNGKSIAKVILFQFCKTGFIRKTRRKSSILSFKRVKIRGSLARNARFDVSNSQDGRSCREVSEKSIVEKCCRKVL